MFGAQALDCDLNFSDSSVCADVEFKQKPNRKKSSDFTLTFLDAASKKPKAIDQQVHVYLWMKMKNGHEHGSEEVKIQKVGEGKYLITNVWFLMLGKWQLRAELKDKAGNVVDKASMEVLVERGTSSKSK